MKEYYSSTGKEPFKASGNEFDVRLETRMDQVSRSISDEHFHPYPENFMIPKGVCEKSEPVIIITK